MPLQQIDVKGYTRKGKLVKAYKRKQDKKNIALKAAIGTAATLGISATVYLVLKKRYTKNLDDVAKNLKANANIGEKLSDDIKDMTFTIGGLGGGVYEAGKKLDIDDSPLNQAKYIATQIKRIIGSKNVKKHSVIPLDHNFSFPLSGNELIDSPKRTAFLSKELFKGGNKESIQLAEKIYSWHTKNPNKPINIVSFSAGTNMSRDVQYILGRKNIKVNLVTLGGTDFKITPSDKSLNLMGVGDSVRTWRSSNAKMVNVDKHRPDSYLKNEDVKKMIKRHLYSDE